MLCIIGIVGIAMIMTASLPLAVLFIVLLLLYMYV